MTKIRQIKADCQYHTTLYRSLVLYPRGKTDALACDCFTKVGIVSSVRLTSKCCLYQVAIFPLCFREPTLEVGASPKNETISRHFWPGKGASGAFWPKKVALQKKSPAAKLLQSSGNKIFCVFLDRP